MRYAPSPTGYVHIGGARTALFNWLYARRHGGAFILRVEDTDVERTIEDSVSQMTEQLSWLGLDWDEGPGVGGEYGPYFQSQRLPLYREASDRLLAEGKAYYCYCTPEELERQRHKAREEGRAPRYDGRCRHLTPSEARQLAARGIKPAVRLLTPDSGTTVVHDLIHGTIEFDNSLIGDFVILKSDGYPTYNFACVVDDAGMHISDVIRADEHVSNTPRQVWLYQALGYPMPRFAHVPMVLAPDRSKLSKRHGATSVAEFREQGYLPEAIVNYLAFLGWSPRGESEVMPLQDMVEQFSLEAVSRTAAIYDVTKLTWMNGHYLRTVPLNSLVEYALPFLARAGLVSLPVTAHDRLWLERLLQTVRDRIKLLSELPDAVSYFFRDPVEYEERGVRRYLSHPDVPRLLRETASRLSRLKDFDLDGIEGACRQLIADEGISGGTLIHPVRLALTGRTAGPGLFHVIWLLGREKTVDRLESAARMLDA